MHNNPSWKSTANLHRKSNKGIFFVCSATIRKAYRVVQGWIGPIIQNWKRDRMVLRSWMDNWVYKLGWRWAHGCKASWNNSTMAQGTVDMHEGLWAQKAQDNRSKLKSTVKVGKPNKENLENGKTKVMGIFRIYNMSYVSLSLCVHTPVSNRTLIRQTLLRLNWGHTGTGSVTHQHAPWSVKRAGWRTPPWSEYAGCWLKMCPYPIPPGVPRKCWVRCRTSLLGGWHQLSAPQLMVPGVWFTGSWSTLEDKANQAEVQQVNEGQLHRWFQEAQIQIKSCIPFQTRISAGSTQEEGRKKKDGNLKIQCVQFAISIRNHLNI